MEKNMEEKNKVTNLIKGALEEEDCKFRINSFMIPEQYPFIFGHYPSRSLFLMKCLKHTDYKNQLTASTVLFE